MYMLSFNGLFAQKFQIIQIFSQLQNPVRFKLTVCKIINLAFFLLIKSLSWLLK